MFGSKKTQPTIDPEQRELIENAQRRLSQKKRLWSHFVLFLVGSVFLIVLNLVLEFGKNVKIGGVDWFVIAILFWAFLFVVHAVNVAVTSKFMGKDWERAQLDKLVTKQKARIAELQANVDQEMPLPEKKTLDQISF